MQLCRETILNIVKTGFEHSVVQVGHCHQIKGIFFMIVTIFIILVDNRGKSEKDGGGKAEEEI